MAKVVSYHYRHIQIYIQRILDHNKYSVNIDFSYNHMSQ